MFISLNGTGIKYHTKTLVRRITTMFIDTDYMQNTNYQQSETSLQFGWRVSSCLFLTGKSKTIF